LAGELGEIVVVWLYSAVTGGDAAMALATSPPRSGWMARQQLPVWPSHMGLAVALCVALSATIQAMAGVLVGDAAIISLWHEVSRPYGRSTTSSHCR
jgi:hypothetical protein